MKQDVADIRIGFIKGGQLPVLIDDCLWYFEIASLPPAWTVKLINNSPQA